MRKPTPEEMAARRAKAAETRAKNKLLSEARARADAAADKENAARAAKIEKLGHLTPERGATEEEAKAAQGRKAVLQAKPPASFMDKLEPRFQPPPMPSTLIDPVLTGHADAIRALGKRVVGDIVEIGRRLTDAKVIAGHGNWLPWLDAEFGWKERTAQRFISVYEASTKTSGLTDLNLPMEGFYALAARSTPDEARKAVVERAKAGERVSVAEVKSSIAAAKGEKRKPRAAPDPARTAQPEPNDQPAERVAREAVAPDPDRWSEVAAMCRAVIALPDRLDAADMGALPQEVDALIARAMGVLALIGATQRPDIDDEYLIRDANRSERGDAFVPLTKVIADAKSDPDLPMKCIALEVSDMRFSAAKIATLASRLGLRLVADIGKPKPTKH